MIDRDEIDAMAMSSIVRNIRTNSIATMAAETVDKTDNPTELEQAPVSQKMTDPVKTAKLRGKVTSAGETSTEKPASRIIRLIGT